MRDLGRGRAHDFGNRTPPRETRHGGCRRSGDDPRRTEIILGDVDPGLLEQAERHASQVNARAAQAITEAEMEQLMKLLHNVLNHMEDG